jgi:endonuclease YncB( thermonuclease family)
MSTTVPAGWYPDPDVSAQQRYWDGAAWTAHTAPVSAPPAGEASAYGSLTPPPALPPTATRKAKRSLPVWAWIVLGAVAVLLGVVMSPILAVLFLVVLITGIVALVRNRPTWLGFRSRKTATWVTAAATVGLLMTGSIANLVSPNRADNQPVAFADNATPATSPTASVTPTRTPTPTPTPTETAASLVAVIDGDTIETSAGKVRLIGIDAPEQGSWGYAEAAAELNAFLASGPITLVSVAGRDDTDNYGRLLRYVRAGGKDAGQHLLTTGWAIAKYDGRDGYGSHPLQAEYISLDAAHEMPAQPAPEPVAPAPAPVEPAPVAPAPVEPQPAPPAAPAPPTAYYANCSEARAAGAAPIYAGQPGYSRKLDRDGDGIACE